MDYTQSNSYVIHEPTGKRMHDQSQATPTQISEDDLNQPIWSLMALIESVGLVGQSFYQEDPATYTKVRDAVQMLIQRQTPSIGVAGGTPDAITATFLPAITSLTPGMQLLVRSSAANATTTPSFTPNLAAIGAWPIVKGANQALVAGDIPAAGFWMELRCDPVTNKWVLMNPATGVSAVGGFQAFDDTLTALSGLATAANQMIYSSGPNDFSMTPLTPFARTFLDDADAAAVRSTLGAVASSAFGNSLAENGYQQLPGGLIIQWGYIAPASRASESNLGTITFPIAFPTACRNVGATVVADPSTGTEENVNCWTAVRSPTVTGFTLFLASTIAATSSVGVYWTAIGN